MIKKMYLMIALVAIIAGSQIQAMGLPAARVAGQATSEAVAKYSAEYGPMLRQKAQQAKEGISQRYQQLRGYAKNGK
jgi:ribulose kinase